MVSEDKLIRNGIKKTDAWFNRFKKRIQHDLNLCTTYEEFIERTRDYTTQNILINSGYSQEMQNIIQQAIHNHKFERASQRALLEETINNNVGMLIQNVGETIKETVRDTVRQGYDEGLHPNEIARNIHRELDTINNTRCRVIARTEVKRTDTVANYVRHRDQGASGFTVQCRPDCCPYCAEEYDEEGEALGGNVQFSMDETDKLPPLHPNSYFPDTQVYTDHGWKYFYELTDDDLLLSLNPETEETEFIQPVQIVKHDNQYGYMYHIHNNWFDICITPDHDCFIHQRKYSKNRYYEPEFRKPGELNSESHFVRCIDTDRENPETININGLEFKPADFAFFMAWYISEGSVLHNPETAETHGYPIKISQTIEVNRRIIEPVFQDIADYLGIKLYVAKQYFEFHSKELYDYLIQLGRSHEKYIPSEVFALNRECLNIFLDSYILGDGHERIHGRYNSVERSVFTSSTRLKDDISYLILLCGYYPSIYIHSKAGTVTRHKNGTYTQNYDVWGIRINRSKYTQYRSCIVDKLVYDGTVYCVELPKWHTLWVKRNGKTSWNGNCRCTAMFYYNVVSDDQYSNKKI